jgi:molecular chaperone DnaK (HSP70)
VTDPRYVVGIDLGTTHTALAYLPLDGDPDAAPRPTVFEVPQLVARATLESRALLPSFLYLAHESEGPMGLPWDAARTYAVGHHARARGAESPGRLVSSAKSWLCHPGIDRRSALLPAGSDEVERVSPVEASFRYLEHLAEAWDATVALGDESRALRNQEIVLTVPASFDAVARELTAEAAYAAGLERLTLLEEPQAALYAWLNATGGGWRKQLRPGDLLLVVDIGGGTSDFSAIAVVDEGGSLGLERVAVGDHILLGGDNMDLALAYLVRQKLKAEGKEIDAWQMNALVHAARGAKEQLLSSPAEEAAVVIPGRGAKLLGGAVRSSLRREELQKVLVEGFFPAVDRGARPAQRARGALTQLGLPYASDPAITRHLASFLGRQGAGLERFSKGGALAPTAVLFNGGVMRGDPLQRRLTEVLAGWSEAAGTEGARVLDGADLDLGVARGAAVYGLVRRGRGLRIRGGTARSYYVGIESPAPAVPGLEPPITALCVAPFGMEEGTSADLPAQELGLVVGEPVTLRFFSSSVRRADAAGLEVEGWPDGDIEELPPIEVTLPPEGRRAGDVVPVRLRASVTEVGTLLLEAVPTRAQAADERWKIEFNVRGDAQALRRRDRSRHHAHRGRLGADRRRRAAGRAADPAAGERERGGGAPAAALVPLRAARGRGRPAARHDPRGRPAVGVGRVGQKAGRRGAGAARDLGQELARSRGRRPDRADPALRRGRRGRRAPVAGRGERPDPAARAARLGAILSGILARRSAGRAHGAGVLRRGGAGADRGGDAPGRPRRRAARGAAGRVP